MNKIFFLIFLILSKQALSVKNLVIITGKKRSRIETQSPSSKGSFNADEISSTSLKSYTKTKSSLETQEGSEIKANDFILPKIRGQRQENTEIWLNDSLIYDPWLSLPIPYSFNSRQFSQVNIFEGLSPYEIASSNPFGLLQYQKNSFKDKSLVGTRFGAPFGKNFYAQVERKRFILENFSFSLFFSLHDTKGAYSYWNNEGTLFNTKNGKTETLQHNSQDSYFISPFLSYYYKEVSFNFYSFIYKEKRELPLLNNLSEEMSLDNFSFLNHFELTWAPKKEENTTIKPEKISLTFNHQKGEKNYTSSYYKTESNSDHFRFSFMPSWKNSFFKTHSSLAYSYSQVSYLLKNELYRPERNAFDFYTAYQIKFLSPFFLENKYHLRFSKDSKKQTNRELSFSYSFSLFYKKQKGNIYFQFAQQKRLPNLLEELGDNHFISESEGLRSEKSTHLELGGKIAGKNSFMGNVFCDFSSDKIRFIPASFQKVKALNLSKTRTFGFELSHNLKTYYFDMLSGFSYFHNLDTSNQKKHTLVPLSSFYVFTNHMEIKVKEIFFHLSQRLNGPYYYDSANTILIKPHLLSDLATGYSYKIKNTLFSVKFSLNNLFDVNSLELETRGKKKNFGKIPRSEFYGIPLPGRTWAIDLEAKF